MSDWDNLVEPTRDALEALLRKGDEMADRIEELEAKLLSATMDGYDMAKYAYRDRIEELEAKLALVIAAYRIEAMRRDDYSHDAFDQHIAELKGPPVK